MAAQGLKQRAVEGGGVLGVGFAAQDQAAGGKVEIDQRERLVAGIWIRSIVGCFR